MPGPILTEIFLRAVTLLSYEKLTLSNSIPPFAFISSSAFGLSLISVSSARSFIRLSVSVKFV